MDCRKFGFIAAVLFIACVGTAASAQQVFYGGVGFISWEDRAELFPQTSKLLCRKAPCPHGNIDIMARPYFLDKPYGKFELSRDLIGTREVEGVIMAPMIARESLGITKDVTAGKTSFIHIYRLFANLMFFEFGTGRFISARPVVIQYTDTLDQPASEAEQLAVFSDLVANETRGENIFKRLYERAQTVNPFTFSEKYVRITEVNIGESVEAIISNSVATSAWRTQVGQILEANLVEDTDAPLIPSINQDQLNSELTATFASASHKIVLPDEPAFRIALDIRRFKKFESVKGRQKTVCHAVSTTMRVNGELGELMNVRFSRTKKACGVVALDQQLDDAFYFSTSLFSLLNQISKQFGDGPDKKFLKQASGKDPHAADHIRRVKKEVFHTGL